MYLPKPEKLGGSSEIIKPISFIVQMRLDVSGLSEVTLSGKSKIETRARTPDFQNHVFDPTTLHLHSNLTSWCPPIDPD